MAGYLYYGEAAGGRIIRAGVGFSQIGDAYAFEVSTWGEFPAEDEGEVIFRTLVAKIRHTNGYDVTLQAVVDDLAQAVQGFSGGPPSGGRSEELATCRVWLMKRGTQLAVIFKAQNLTGDVELADLATAFIPIRTSR